MSEREFHKSVEVRYTVDVFVAGGGHTGCEAAAAAARKGATVLLVEATACLGGRSTAGLACAYGTGADVETLKRSYDAMLEESGASFLLMARVISVSETDGKWQAICAGKSGLFAVDAAEYLNCTGDSSLGAMPKAMAVTGAGKLTLHALYADASGERAEGPDVSIPLTTGTDARAVTAALVQARKHICAKAKSEASLSGNELVATGILPDFQP